MPAQHQRGFVHLLPLILVGALLVLGYLVYSGTLKFSFKKGVKVELQTQYFNPFEKSAQYVNPFSTYKNPFDGL